MSEAEILDSFVAEYGEWILVLPEKRGFNLLAWILPIVGVVLGGIALTAFVRGAQRSRAETADDPSGAMLAEPEQGPVASAAVVPDAAQPPLEDEYRARLAREIADG